MPLLLYEGWPSCYTTGNTTGNAITTTIKSGYYSTSDTVWTITTSASNSASNSDWNSDWFVRSLGDGVTGEWFGNYQQRYQYRVEPVPFNSPVQVGQLEQVDPSRNSAMQADIAEIDQRFQARLDQEMAGAENRAKARIDAMARADSLLKSILDPDQRQDFEKHRRFDVITKRRTGDREIERRYRIRYGIAGNIYLLNSRGEEVEKFCIHGGDELPTADHMISQKLLLEADEDLFLSIANRSIPGAGVGAGWYPAARGRVA